MKNIAIAPLPPQFLARVRTEGRDDLGQPVKRVVAEGGEPCRDALRRAQPGQELILASFSPFSKEGPYREFGPLFVFANEQPSPASRDALPLDGYLRQQFVIRAYSEEESIVDAALITPAEAEDVVRRFFTRSDVAFLHVRFPVYGCFACRIDRVASPNGLTS